MLSSTRSQSTQTQQQPPPPPPVSHYHALGGALQTPHASKICTLARPAEAHRATDTCAVFWRLHNSAKDQSAQRQGVAVSGFTSRLSLCIRASSLGRTHVDGRSIQCYTSDPDPRLLADCCSASRGGTRAVRSCLVLFCTGACARAPFRRQALRSGALWPRPRVASCIPLFPVMLPSWAVQIESLLSTMSTCGGQRSRYRWRDTRALACDLLVYVNFLRRHTFTMLSFDLL